MNRFWLLRGGWLAGVCLCAAPDAPTQEVSPAVRYIGMCDASAGVALDANRFAVANDEDSVIRIYAPLSGGTALDSVVLDRFLRVETEKKPETDFEGAAWLDDQIFWITSHGCNQEGKYRPSRHRFFATRWVTNQARPRLVPVGVPYQFLVMDMMSDPRLRPFRLGVAAALPPKAPGALNIEGLCATPEKHLLIGFRNPIAEGRALLLPMLNPKEVVRGQNARFGDPVLLDLEGRGVRDLAYWRGEYLIVAGRFDEGGKSRLYRWAGGKTKPVRIRELELGEINPEAIVTYPAPEPRLQLLSDDGTVKVGGVRCKDLPDSTKKSFRSVWVKLPGNP